MKESIRKILKEETSCSFSWAKNLKYWGKQSGWRKGMIQTINRALRDIYSNMWERPTKKHMSTGGVVGYEVAQGSTFGWSILNFFNAHRNVREALIDEYGLWLSKEGLACEFKIKDFLNWVFAERQILFGMNTSMVKKLAALNHRSWNKGAKNESEAVEYLITLYGNEWGAEWDGEPGMFRDALTGADIIMINKNTGQEHAYQAKPLVNAEMIDNDNWKVQSRGLYPYSTKTVNYYIFNTAGKEGVMIFKNNGEKPIIEKGKEYMIFDTSPIAQTI